MYSVAFAPISSCEALPKNSMATSAVLPAEAVVKPVGHAEGHLARDGHPRGVRREEERGALHDGNEVHCSLRTFQRYVRDQIRATDPLSTVTPPNCAERATSVQETE